MAAARASPGLLQRWGEARAHGQAGARRQGYGRNTHAHQEGHVGTVGTGAAVCVRVRKARLPATAQRLDYADTGSVRAPVWLSRPKVGLCLCFPACAWGREREGEREGEEKRAGRRAGRQEGEEQGKREAERRGRGRGTLGSRPASPTQAPSSCAQPSAHWPQSLLLGPVHVLHDPSQAGKQRWAPVMCGNAISVKTEHKGHFSK